MKNFPWLLLLAVVVVGSCAPENEQPKKRLFTQRDDALSTSVVISQVFGGGGNAMAPYNTDYIELFNRGTSPVNLAGWSVQYASSAGTSWTVTNLTGTIQPGRYLLIAEGTAGTNGNPLPTPNVTGTATMNALAASDYLLLAGQCDLTIGEDIIDGRRLRQTGQEGGLGQR